jgi:hypothetical protein
MPHTPRPAADRPLTIGAIVACPDPDCDQLAEVVALWDWPSTTGFLAHARTRCLARHVFTPRLDAIVPVVDAAAAASALLAAGSRLTRQEAR